MEPELYQQLTRKLKIRGMNAIFGIKSQIVIGENLVISIIVSFNIYFFSKTIK